MEKRFYCYVCGEDPCLFVVKNPHNPPFACPFDKKHNAVWRGKASKKKFEKTCKEKQDVIYDSEQGEILDEIDKEQQ